MIPAHFQECINTMTREECGMVWAMLKRRYQILDILATMEVEVGQRVEFTARGRLHTGVVTKMGPKNAKVTTDEGIKWTVTASLLRPANA